MISTDDMLLWFVPVAGMGQGIHTDTHNYPYETQNNHKEM